MPDNFFTLWPFLLLLLGLLLLFPLLRRDPQWSDRTWWLHLLLPIYIIHQFEENGLDLFFRRFHFHVSLCNWLGYHKAEVALCPADAPFLFVVNAVEGTLLILIALLLGPRRPLAGAIAFAVSLTNALLHLYAGVVHCAYHPGLLTALILLLPLSLSYFQESQRLQWSTKGQLGLAMGCGVYIHLAVLVCLRGLTDGWISRELAMAVQVVSSGLPMLSLFLKPKGLKKFSP